MLELNDQLIKGDVIELHDIEQKKKKKNVSLFLYRSDTTCNIRANITPHSV